LHLRDRGAVAADRRHPHAYGERAGLAGASAARLTPADRPAAAPRKRGGRAGPIRGVGVTRRAKIVCTLGPATSTAGQIESLVAAGMNVARRNFSHGEHADHEAACTRVRAAAEKAGRPVGILADLQGPKIRLGRFIEGETVWRTGETVRITVDEVDGTHDRVSTTYTGLAQDAAAGDRLLVDDGKVALVVTGVDGNDVVCRVTEGGPVSNHKGVSLPGMNGSVPAMSEEGVADGVFALRMGVDFIALAFV